MNCIKDFFMRQLERFTYYVIYTKYILNENGNETNIIQNIMQIATEIEKRSSKSLFQFKWLKTRVKMYLNNCKLLYPDYAYHLNKFIKVFDNTSRDEKNITLIQDLIKELNNCDELFVLF